MARRSKRYRVTLDGCDDSTRAWLDLSASELATLQRVAEAVNTQSNYGCQPTMQVSNEPAHLAEEHQSKEGGL